MAKTTEAAQKKANGETEPLVIARDRCHLAEAKRNTWEIDLPAGTGPDALLNPQALGPLAKDLHPKDLVYAEPQNGGALFVYRVVFATGSQVQLALLQKFDLPQPAYDSDADPVGFKIKRDSVHGWHIIRESDGVMMGSQTNNPDLRTREACRRYTLDHATVRQVR